MTAALSKRYQLCLINNAICPELSQQPPCLHVASHAGGVVIEWSHASSCGRSDHRPILSMPVGVRDQRIKRDGTSPKIKKVRPRHTIAWTQNLFVHLLKYAQCVIVATASVEGWHHLRTQIFALEEHLLLVSLPTWFVNVCEE